MKSLQTKVSSTYILFCCTRFTLSLYICHDISLAGFGPITFVHSDDVLQLPKFYKSVENLHAGYIHNMPSSGGDIPEYALYAMLQGLRAQDGDYPLMIEGSQMVVLTDAPSKQPYLDRSVIDVAVNGKICIHFFINHPQNTLEDGIYEEIASKTHGSLFSQFSHWDIARFAEAYRSNRCDFLEEFREERSLTSHIPFVPSDNPSDISDIPLSQCKNFSVSRLAADLRLSIQADTGNNITISRPNGTVSTLTVGNNNLAFFNEAKPESGQWSVCGNRSTIEFKVNDIVTYNIDATILYNNASLVPPACKCQI